METIMILEIGSSNKLCNEMNICGVHDQITSIRDEETRFIYSLAYVLNQALRGKTGQIKWPRPRTKRTKRRRLIKQRTGFSAIIRAFKLSLVITR